MARLLILFAFAFLFVESASAQAVKSLTAQELLMSCKVAVALIDKQRDLREGDDLPLNECSGMLRGALDGIQLYNGWFPEKKIACIPEGVNLAQITRIVVRDFEAQPNLLHLDANEPLVRSIINAFPCAA